jgi:hypothetical protein
MVPWVNHHEILTCQQTYDIAQFKNEVLGLSTTLGEHVVTRAELEACCTQDPMAQSPADIPRPMRPHLVAGIDWGGGRLSRTVVTIGYHRQEDNKFVVAHMQHFRADENPKKLIESVANLCRRFGVQLIAADGRGNGLTNNRLLLDALRYQAHLYGIVYSQQTSEPVQDGTLLMWTVDRSSSIGKLYGYFRKRSIVLPRLADCRWYIDELACELAEFDDEKRGIRYIKPPDQRDDALHATTYAMLLMHHQLPRLRRLAL